MKISLNEIKKYTPIPKDLTTQSLVDLIGSRLVEVEGFEDLSLKYQGIYIARVVSCSPIPDTHLHLCQIDVGATGDRFSNTVKAQGDTVSEGSDSDEGDSAPRPLVQVVCGAPNVHEGMLAVWIAPNSVVPSTYGNEDFRLSVRKLRGYDSYGMLAALDELDLGADHEGIAEIDPAFAQAGDNFAEKFELNDIILDIENKSLTHRPDTFGLIGFSREVAGILGQKFVEPTFLTKESVFPSGFFQQTSTGISSVDPPLSVQIPDSDLCPRYSCVVIKAPVSSPNSYLTLEQVFLAKAGMRSVSPIVDLTNIIMLQTGQPLHAFDYDKFKALGDQIIVRAANNSEQLTLLDGKTITCDDNDILITANDTPIALAGAMGGQNTAIDANTEHILLESATFSLYHLRKTQMKHGIFSEAITRFTKGQPATQTFNVLAETVRRLDTEPIAVVDYYPAPQLNSPVIVSVAEINACLGSDYDQDTIIQTLENVNFTVKLLDEEKLSVQPIGWRTDIHIKEDVIEEIGRLLGYDNIPQALPTRSFASHTPAPLISLKTKLRNILSDQLSAHEFLTYSFVSGNILELVGQDPNNSYRIVNSISPELQYFRQALIPSLLDKIQLNVRSGYEAFTAYEFNQISLRGQGLNAENVPIMQNHLGCIAVSEDYYGIKAKLNFIARELSVKFDFRPLESSLSPYLEPSHSADIYCADKFIGSIGEIRATILAKLKVKSSVASFELDLDKILSLSKTVSRIKHQSSRFPSVSRDLTMSVSASTQYQQVYDLLHDALSSKHLIFQISPTSIYQAPDSSSKNLSFHLSFAHSDKTLQSSEISDIMEQISINATKKLGARIV